MADKESKYIPTDIISLLVKLKVISMIQRGKKLNVNDLTFVDSKSWIGAYTRATSGESRQGLITYLDQTIAQTIEAIDDYQNTEYQHLLISELDKARAGISNLLSTYNTDPITNASIQVCLDSIELQLKKFENIKK